MAFRFRKSFKLAPGVRVNLGKRGASLSLGGRGITTNLSSRGVRQTFAIPGSGMSWSKTYSSGAATRRANAGIARAQRETQYEEALREVEAAESKIRDVVEAWRKMPDIPEHAVIEMALQPRPYSAIPEPLFPDLKVQEQTLRKQARREVAARYSMRPLYIALATLVGGFVLTGVTDEGAFGALAVLGVPIYLSVWGLRRYAKISRQARHEANAKWAEAERDIHASYESAIHEHRQHEAERKNNWDHLERERIGGLRRLLAGDRETVDEAIQAVLEDLDFPFEATCTASALSGDTVVVAVDLPELEDIIPEIRLKALKDGSVKEVRRSQRDQRDAWRHLVLGIALQLGRTICAVAPTVQHIKVAGYTQRRQRNGTIADDWVYDLALARHFLTSLHPENVDPSAVLRLPHARVLPTADGNLKKIPAPEWLGDLVAE
jgi:hypothetical protein